MKNAYARALTILEKDLNFRDVVYEIARKNPSVFVAAVDRLQPSLKLYQWEVECAAIMKSGRKIDAIKRCRELTGMGLKDAKDAVERLQAA